MPARLGIAPPDDETGERGFREAIAEGVSMTERLSSVGSEMGAGRAGTLSGG
jgi:hypothetical protein